MQAQIVSVGAYVPSRRMHNDELAKLVDTSDEWIYSHTGIHSRHIAADDEAASDLATKAAEVAIERAGISRDEIDLVILATSTPDYIGLPSTACVVQDKLGLENAGAMDVMAACTGFVYALETARTFIVSGAKQCVLVVATEVYSKIVNWEDRRTCVLFGDGAGALIVKSAPDDSPSRVMPALLGSRGSGAEALSRSHGGTRNPYIPGVTPEASLKLQMDGRAVYNFAVPVVRETIQSILDREGIDFGSLERVVPHQANVRILQATAKRAGWDFERFHMNIEEYANTSAASIPIALNEMWEADALVRGAALLTVGFGAGLTFGGQIIYW